MSNNFLNNPTSPYLNKLCVNNKRSIVQNFDHLFVFPEKSFNCNSPSKILNGAADGSALRLNLKLEETKKIPETSSLTNLKEVSKNDEYNIKSNLIIKIELPQDFLKHKKNSICDVEIKNKKNDSNSNWELPKKFKCEIKNCGKSFSKKFLLKDHRQNEHTEVFTCTYEKCTSSFIYMENLVKHQQLHEQKAYLCSYTNCTQSFSIYFNLKRHYKSHFNSNNGKHEQRETSDRIESKNIKENLSKTYLDKDEENNEKNNVKKITNIVQEISNKEFTSKNNSNNMVVCSHPNCNLQFKTDKLRKIHHNYLEQECKEEKEELLKTLKKMVDFVKFALKGKETKKNFKNESVNLFQKYKDFYDNFTDQALFYSSGLNLDELSK